MNLQSLFQDFNPSKFLVYSCLLVFTLLLALRLDGTITISYWIVFGPLWFWKTLVILGALIGTIVWIRNPEYRQSDNSYVQFKSMLISLSLQLLLLMFELLVCDKLESERHLWTLAFIPLVFISLLSIAICIWALKNDRGFEMELFFSVNILQFIFIALRMDQFIKWSWIVVFVPLWIVMCLAIIGVMYALIFAAILFRTPEVAVQQRKASLRSAVTSSLVVMPLVVFLVLLSNKLDGNDRTSFMQLSPRPSRISSVSFLPAISHANIHFTAADFDPNNSSVHTTNENDLEHHRINNNDDIDKEMTYFVVCMPLYFVFFVLLCLSFGGKRGNLWWFGMRKDFCGFFLCACPCLREYANTSYSKNSRSNNELCLQRDRDILQGITTIKPGRGDKLSHPPTTHTVVTHSRIDAPD